MNDLWSRAIGGIESGGKYDILGPPTKKGDPNSPRAIGKYQVMPANIPQWTKEALGRALTPEEFRASPDAQEAVFKTKFGQFAAKYGPEGAARTWFTGSPTGKGTDVLGTTGDKYVRLFNTATRKPGVSNAPPELPSPTGGMENYEGLGSYNVPTPTAPVEKEFPWQKALGVAANMTKPKAEPALKPPTFGTPGPLRASPITKGLPDPILMALFGKPI